MGRKRKASEGPRGRRLRRQQLPMGDAEAELARSVTLGAPQ
eukprot:COSAG04_NODE_16860_length_486_cov_1.950904_2_plen_40_part_01